MRIICILALVAINVGALGKYFVYQLNHETLILPQFSTSWKILTYPNIFILNHVEACCCSFWVRWYPPEVVGHACGCNFFGCNCNFAGDDICYYGPDDGYLGYCALRSTLEIEACHKNEESLQKTKKICRSNERCSAITAKDIVGSISTIILT